MLGGGFLVQGWTWSVGTQARRGKLSGRIKQLFEEDENSNTLTFITKAQALRLGDKVISKDLLPRKQPGSDLELPEGHVSFLQGTGRTAEPPSQRCYTSSVFHR